MLTLRVCGSPLNCLEYNQIGDMVAIGSQNGKFFLSVPKALLFNRFFPRRFNLFVQSVARWVLL